MGEWIKTRYAENLSEVYHHINKIADEDVRKTREEVKTGQKKNDTPILWFRGHAKASYNLGPSIFRGTNYQYNGKKTYSNNHLREEYRLQSFMSRNYDNVNYRIPQTMIEWQEVMQHYFTKTRLMDWSESLTIALEFALEAFITPVKDLEIQAQCKAAEPAIWVLKPARLNKCVYNSFAENRWMILKALGERETSLASKIQEELVREKESGLYYNLEDGLERNINAMVSLSSLEMLRRAFWGRELEALKTFEMNPFFYLILRYYADGIPAQMGTLPPLAIIHPYHSQRIKMQKGVFTVFPYYIPDKNMEILKEKNKKYPPIGMEYMDQCGSCLQKILITDPEKVARELMLAGVRKGHIYPDIQTISQDMENVVVL